MENNMTDLIIINEELPVIDCNFGEVKSNLVENLKKYETLVVTEESLSLCKQEQKSLAGLKKKIDTYRKDIKKKMSVPISEFEDKCKELFGLVEQAEEPLKTGIKVYDDETRQNKIKLAEEHIEKQIQELELNNKYSSKLNVLDSYSNLSSKDKATLLDIEQRAAMLKIEQTKELEMIEMVEDAIEKENKNISQKMKLDDFKMLIESNAYSVKNLVNAVEEKAKDILRIEEELKEKAKRELEREQEEKRIKEEQEALRLAEEKVIEEEQKRLKLEQEQEELERQYELQQQRELEANLKKETVETAEEAEMEMEIEKIALEHKEDLIEVMTEVPRIKKYNVELSVIGSVEEMKLLKNFLYTNGFNYEVKAQTVLK